MRGLLVAAVLANVAAPLPPFLVGSLGVEIGHDLRLSPATLGLSVSAFFVTTAVTSTVGGRLIDRQGWLWPLRAGTLVTTVVLVLLGTRPGVAALVILLACAGIGNSLAVVATNAALAARMSPQRLAVAVGITQSAVPLSGLVAGVSVPIAAGAAGWPAVFVVAAALPFSAAVLFFALFRQRDAATTPIVAGASTSGHRRALIWATLSASLATVIVSVLGTLFVVLLTASGTGPATAGLLLVLGGATGAGIRVASGVLIRDPAAQGMRVMVALLCCGAIGFLLLAAGFGGPVAVIATVLAFSGGWGWPATFYGNLLRRHAANPAHATGTALTGMAVFAIIGPACFGAVLEHDSASAAWIGLAVVMVAAAAAGWRSDALYRT